MMKQVLTVLLWGTVLGWSGVVTDVFAIDYYHARIPVESQSQYERNRAAKAGLLEVLVRVSGTEQFEQGEALTPALANASSYIDQFQYELERNQWGDKQEFLVMTFSPSVVERILKESGLPFWPTNRPKTLVWLVEDHPEAGKQLINDSQTDTLQSLMSAAEVRGVPLRLPLLDLDDQLAISPEAVWTLQEQEILDASERYGVDTVLVGRYSKTTSGQWWATWQFFHRGDSRSYDVKVDEVEQLGQRALAPLADYLAGLYAITPNLEGDASYVLQVSGVRSFADYRGVNQYLSNLAAVTDFQYQLLEGENVLIKLQLNGDLEQFDNAISLDQKLQAAAKQVSPDAPWIVVPQGTADRPLEYIWVGG